jgi:hypothetical protein
LVRSTTVSNCRPSLALPNGSSTGPTTEPSAVMRSVWPLIVRSPVSVATGPSTFSSTDSKRISGYCSASKNSGD